MFVITMVTWQKVTVKGPYVTEKPVPSYNVCIYIQQSVDADKDISELWNLDDNDHVKALTIMIHFYKKHSS